MRIGFGFFDVTKFHELIDARNQADGLIHATNKSIAELGEKVSEDEKKDIEAAIEVARQIRLRDLGGIVVVDFIDMDRRGNRAKVEKAMRDAMKSDKARFTVSRISKPFASSPPRLVTSWPASCMARPGSRLSASRPLGASNPRPAAQPQNSCLRAASCS